MIFKKVVFIYLLVLVTFTLKSQTEESKWGNRPELAKNKFRLYNEFYSFNKNMDEAYPRWSWLFVNAPKVDKRIYLEGPDILKYKIDKETDGSLKQKYLDTLFMIYDQRIIYFGERGKVLGLKAVDLFNLRLDAKYYDELFATAKESVELEGNMTHQKVLPVYSKSYLIQNKLKKASKEDFLGSLSKVNEVVAYKQVNPSIYKEEYKTVRDELVALAYKQALIDSCEDVITIFQPAFDLYADDVHLQRYYYEGLRDDSCISQDVFEEVAIKLLEHEPSAEIAYNLSLHHKSNENYDDALRYLQKSVELETDHKKKALYYYDMANIYFNKQPDINLSITHAEKAGRENIDWGLPYVLLGDVYVSQNALCDQDTIFGGNAMYFLAIDQYTEALRRQPELHNVVNKKMKDLQPLLPTEKEVTDMGYKKGLTYQIDCWMSGFTTIKVKQAK